ncbi:hypothetical protein FACS1894163_07450 [Spirochaetia bacterium]|nr:hypothetical protein FACS1894163_07450 [Spirochaetia bacterium]
MKEKGTSEYSKPIIYQGRSIPFYLLSPEGFQNFLYGFLKLYFAKMNIQINSIPGNIGDGGFDIDAKNINNDVICIQCKQYSNTDLDLKKISNELAKVALRSYLENSNVIEHYIISSGKVKGEVYSALREATREIIIGNAIKELKNDKNYVNDKESLKEKYKDINFENIVKTYITNLENIHIWSGAQLDCEIGLYYSEIADLVEHHFTIERVLIEHPRPNFNENKYLQKYLFDNFYICLYYKRVKYQDNIRTNTLADNTPENQSEENVSISAEKIYQYDELIDTNNKYIIISGDGGSGKSVSCMQLARYYSDKRKLDKDSLIPIYIPFDKCSEDLNNTINTELGILYGSWLSIPSKYLLILDGLNEINGSKRKIIIGQLNIILSNYEGRIFIVITTRNPSSLDSPIVIPFMKNKCFYSIQKLNNNQISALIDIHLNQRERINFIRELNTKLNPTNQFFFNLPFGVQLIIDLYKKNKYFSESIPQIIYDYYKIRFDRNAEYLNKLSNFLYDSFLEYVVRLAYIWRVKKNKYYLAIAEILSIITEALEMTKTDKVFGFFDISDREIFQILKDNEILIKNDNTIYFQHDIFADFFASRYFACSWDKDISQMLDISKELLLFSSYYITEKKLEYINIVKNISIGLMSKCCLQMGEEIISHTEQYLIENLNLQDKFSIITYFNAFSVINTDTLRFLLLKIYNNTQGNSIYDRELKYLAKKYLCIMREESIILEVLTKTEHDKSAPINISGGDIFLWDEAVDIKTKVKLSRKRLFDEEKACFASIETLCYMGNQDDVPLIANSIKKTNNSKIFFSGLYHLYQLSPETSLSIIDDCFDNADSNIEKIRILEIRYILQKPRDIKFVINFIVYLNEGDQQSEYTYSEKAIKMLDNVEFNNDQIDYIKKQLNKTERKNRNYLYQIAINHKMW